VSDARRLAPASRYKRPLALPKQEAFLFAPERISITEASTKTGKTWAAWSGSPRRRWRAGRAELLVGGTDPAVAKIAYRRMKRAHPPLDSTRRTRPNAR
jgi:hypothetical protein